MKLRTRILLFVFIFGMIFFIMGIGNTLLLIKGKTVDLTDPVSSFNDTALCQGEIDFVLGPFATLVEERKRYGITTSKNETDFFVVSNIEEGSAFVVFSTANTAMRQKLSDASDKWEKYLSGRSTDIPDISIEFKGKLAKQLDDDDFDTYYNEVREALELQPSEEATLRIMDGELSSLYPITTAAGAVVALIGIIGLIMGFVSDKKKQQQEELW